MRRILFKDLALPQAIPFSRLRTIFSFRNGIFTPIERARERYGNDCQLFYSHPDKIYQDIVAEIDGLIALSANQESITFDEVITSESVDPIRLLDTIDDNIISDFEMMDREQFLSPDEFTLKYPDIEVIGDMDRLFVAKDVIITSKHTIFDTREGIIIVNRGARIEPFTIISGTSYIGEQSEVVNCRMSHNTMIGNHCRVSGEVSSTIFNDYSYKSHDGFIGRTVVGTWVNLGAMTTTSNLKNNYSNISLMLPESNSMRSELIKVSTGNIKFGSLIGDYTKSAIGVMINCGTVLDSGSNILLSRPSYYIPPMRWLDADTEYDAERFISDCEMIMGRKGVSIHKSFGKAVRLMTSD